MTILSGYFRATGDVRRVTVPKPGGKQRQGWPFQTSRGQGSSNRRCSRFWSSRVFEPTLVPAVTGSALSAGLCILPSPKLAEYLKNGYQTVCQSWLCSAFQLFRPGFLINAAVMARIAPSRNRPTRWSPLIRLMLKAEISNAGRNKSPSGRNAAGDPLSPLAHPSTSSPANWTTSSRRRAAVSSIR